MLAVLPHSAASRAGLRPGDLVVAVDSRDSRDEEQLFQALRSDPSPRRVLTVVRPDGSVYAPEVALQAASGPEVSDSLLAQLGDDPSPTSRFVFAASATDLEASRSVLSQLVAHIPSFGLAHAMLADRLFRLAAVSPRPPSGSDDERLRAVHDELARALALDPGSIDVRTVAASLLLDMGEVAGAEGEASRAVELDDRSAKAHFLMGQARLAAGKAPAEAIPELHRAVQLNPYAPLYYDALARAYLMAGRRAEAAKTVSVLRGLRDPVVVTRPARTTAARPVVQTVVGGALLGALAMAALWRRTAHSAARSEVTLGPRASLELWLVEALGAAGALSLALPYLSTAAGFSTGAPLAREIPNHLVPGAVLVAIAVACAPRMLRDERVPDGHLRTMSLVACLSGLAITFSHLALLAQVARGQAPPELAFIHLVAGPVVVVLAALLVARSRLPRAAASGSGR